jgi:hypothetical protein
VPVFLAVIQIRQAKHPPTVIRLHPLFANADGLACRWLELWQTVWAMQAVGEDGQWENTALGVLCALACSRQSSLEIPMLNYCTVNGIGCVRRQHQRRRRASPTALIWMDWAS